jgi:hypothetical protein
MRFEDGHELLVGKDVETDNIGLFRDIIPASPGQNEENLKTLNQDGQ